MINAFALRSLIQKATVAQRLGPFHSTNPNFAKISFNR